MSSFIPRKLKFRAWDKTSNLLVRLHTLECERGALEKKDHFLLQYTGLTDKNGDEIYEQDVLLIETEKFLVFWDEHHSGWYLRHLLHDDAGHPFLPEVAKGTKRFCSRFELTT